jgi:hypothetical protein
MSSTALKNCAHSFACSGRSPGYAWRMFATLRVSTAAAYSSNSARIRGDGSGGGDGGAGGRAPVAAGGTAGGAGAGGAASSGAGAVTGCDASATAALAASPHAAAAAEYATAASAVRRAACSDSARPSAESPRAISSGAAAASVARRLALRASSRRRASSARSSRPADRPGSGAVLVVGFGSGGEGARELSAGGAWVAAGASAGVGAGGLTAAVEGGSAGRVPPVRDDQIHSPTAAATTIAPTIGTSRRAVALVPGSRARRATVGACTGMVPPLGVVNVSSAPIRIPAVCGRSAGCFSRHCMMSEASAGGSPGRCIVTASGSETRCAPRRACGVCAVNGGRPASISYAMTPNAYTSTRWSMAGSAEHCSGAM